MTRKNCDESSVNGELAKPATEWEQALTAPREEGALYRGFIPASAGEGSVMVSYISASGIGDEFRSLTRKLAWATLARRLPISDLHFIEGGLWVNFNSDSVAPHDLIQVWEMWKELVAAKLPVANLAAVFVRGKRVMP